MNTSMASLRYLILEKLRRCCRHDGALHVYGFGEGGQWEWNFVFGGAPGTIGNQLRKLWELERLEESSPDATIVSEDMAATARINHTSAEAQNKNQM